MRDTHCRACASALLVAGGLMLALTGPVAGQVEGFDRLAQLDVGLNPHQISFSEDGRTAWIAVAGSGRIAVVDVPRLTLVGDIPTGGVPLGVIPTPNGLDLAVTRFVDGGVGRYSRRGSHLGGDRPTAVGASLFTGPYSGDRYLVSVERADSMYVFDAATFSFRASYAVGRRPFPASATSDTRKAFVPGFDDGTVTVIDLFGERVLETVDVGNGPTGGAVLPGDQEYAVVVRHDDRVRFINTASHRIVGELAEGIGSSPFSLVVSPNGRLGFVNNTASHDVSVISLPDRRVIGRLPTPALPIVMAVHPSGSSLWVSSEGDDFVTVFSIPERFLDSPLDRPDPLRATAAARAALPRTEVAVMGMIHGAHRTSDRWGIPQVMETVGAFAPDIVCAEIAPDRWGRIERDLTERGVIEDPRVLRFPEYVDDGAILPRMQELGYRVEPCAGWSREMSDARDAVITDFNSDRVRAALYRAVIEDALSAIDPPPLPPDDPRYIHSDAYDERQKVRLAYYDRYQNDLIGPGGWTNINVAHYREIDRVIRDNPGRRILITFGGGHKYWFLEALRRREDVEVIDLTPYVPGG